MVKRLLIKLIKFYQKFISPYKGRKCCIYIPTCSQYAIMALEKYGAVKGGFIALKRILRCNPLSRGGYDPLR
jgi:hypothetical protein